MFELIPIDRRIRRTPSFDPFRDFEELERSFFNGSTVMPAAFRTDISDNGDAFVLESELPGFRKEDIDINIENDCLTITAERKSDTEEKEKNYVKRERVYGSYSRSFDVSAINVEEIDAEYTDGILKLTLPKKAEDVPASRKLEIR